MISESLYRIAQWGVGSLLLLCLIGGTAEILPGFAHWVTDNQWSSETPLGVFHLAGWSCWAVGLWYVLSSGGRMLYGRKRWLLALLFLGPLGGLWFVIHHHRMSPADLGGPWMAGR